MTHFSALTLLPALLAATLMGCASQPTYNTLKTQDGTFEVLQAGEQHESTQAIVIELGLGSTLAEWQPVVNELGKDYRVLAYHRAGVQGSEALLNKDPSVIHQQLRGVIDAAGLEAPYVIMGHSFGGTLGEYYARQSPSDIAGLIMVDARPPAFTQECQRINAGECDPQEAMPKWYLNRMDEGVQAEVKSLSTIEAQTLSSPELSQLPGLVLSASQWGSSLSPAWRQLWVSQQAEYQINNPHWQAVVCNCGHNIHSENPTLLLQNVRSFMTTLPTFQ